MSTDPPPHGASDPSDSGVQDDGRSARTMPGLARDYPDEISLLEVFNLLLRHRHRIVGLAVLVAAVAVGAVFLAGPTWRATAAFVPQGSDAERGRLANLAGQFGINVPTGDAAGQSPAFYAELLRSREVLRPVAEASYTFLEGGAGDGGDAEQIAGTLPEILEIEEETPGLETAGAMEWLREDAVEVRTDPETGMVNLSVDTRWAGLSHAIAERLLTLVNEFNLETRQSRAAAERTFIEGRLAEREDSLLAAENRLESFLQSNRQFENSPELLFRHDRLQRQVARHQQVVTSLSQAYEEARVSEVRNTPVITVLEPAERPLEPESRDLGLRLALGLALGGMLGVFWAFGVELVRRERAVDSESYREFSTLWSRVRRELRMPGARRG